jgi:hypothetical protein
MGSWVEKLSLKKEFELVNEFFLYKIILIFNLIIGLGKNFISRVVLFEVEIILKLDLEDTIFFIFFYFQVFLISVLVRFHNLIWSKFY